jgi:chromate transporter
MPPLSIVWALIALFAPLSLLSLGGGASILAPIHHQTVEIDHWLTQQEFVDLFAISRAAPGPSSMLVVLVGWKMAGWIGALVSCISIYAPSCTLAYGVSRIWNRYRGTLIHSALDRGLVPVGIGLIISGSISVMRAADTGVIGYVIALICGTIMTWRSIHPMILLAGGSLIYTLAMLATGQVPAQ